MREVRQDCTDLTASSLRVVGIKATPAGRAGTNLHDIGARRGLDAAERTRTRERVAAPKFVARRNGSPKFDEEKQHECTRFFK